MLILYDDKFVEKLGSILDYIASDSIVRADNFKNELKKHIELIPFFPYKCRKSKWFDNDNIRDLIFKGYTIPYYINEDKILILDIFKWDR